MMRSPALTPIEAGYVVIGMGVMGLILGTWRAAQRH